VCDWCLAFIIVTNVCVSVFAADKKQSSLSGILQPVPVAVDLLSSDLFSALPGDVHDLEHSQLAIDISRMSFSQRQDWGE
jgi:hypothetical protein